MSATKPVGDLLRELRNDRGSSLRAAARDLGVDASYLSKIERGAKPLPGRLRGRAADYYEADVAQLAIAEGELPADILRILAKHPEAIDDLRKRYDSS
jgi:transcriptional regulator with XRE-family HTH domain